ncbi:MAG TPA: hypothetical protein PKH07_15555 [bacterium]|nr:hypothetical protein [bacterium]
MSLKWPICPECLKEEEEILTQVQHYLRDHPKESLDEVVEALDVDKALIMKFIREKRLIISAGSSVRLTCSSCGAPVLSGTLCRACQARLTGGASPSSESKETTKPSESQAPKSTMTDSRFRSHGGGSSSIKDKFQRG